MRFWSAFRIEGNEMKKMNLTENICKKARRKTFSELFLCLEMPE